MWKTVGKMVPHPLPSVPRIEALEERQLLSGLVSSLGDMPLALPISLPGQATPGVAATINPSSTLLSISPGSAKNNSGAPAGLLDVGLQANVELPGVLDLQTTTNLGIGGSSQAPLLCTNVTLSSATSSAGQTGPSLNVGLSVNPSSGATSGSGSGGTSAGTTGGSSGLSLLVNLALGGHTGSDLQQGASGQGMTPPVINPSPVMPAGVVLAYGVTPENLTSFPAVSALMLPPPGGLPAQAGLPTLFRIDQAGTTSEEVQAVTGLQGPRSDQLAQEKDAAEEMTATPARNALPNQAAPRRTASLPGARGPGEDNSAAESSSPTPDGAEESEATEIVPWLFALPTMLEAEAMQASALGPIDTLAAGVLEELETIPQRVEELMEQVEAGGLPRASWLLLGLVGILAFEVARRQFREDARADLSEEASAEPALV